MLASLLLLQASLLNAQGPIPIYYYDRPPLFFIKDGVLEGKSVQILKTKLNANKIPYQFVEMPAQRQRTIIESNTVPACGIGWFKTTERQKLGKFSVPISTDDPFVLVSHVKYKLPSNVSISDFMNLKELVFLKKKGFSYGDKIDQKELELKPKTYEISTPIKSMLEMIVQREKYYTVIDKSELEHLLKNDRTSLNNISVSTIEEVSKGITRHLWCTFKTPDAFLQQLEN